MKTSIRAFLPLLALSFGFVACSGGGDPKEAGYQALNSGDHKEALAQFDKALASAADADKVELSVARCQALAHVDGDKSGAEFTKLAVEHGDAITIQDYSLVVSEMKDAKAFGAATEVLQLAKDRFPDKQETFDQILTQVGKAVEAAAKAGDPNAAKSMENLKSMGYVGGD